VVAKNLLTILEWRPAYTQQGNCRRGGMVWSRDCDDWYRENKR